MGSSVRQIYKAYYTIVEMVFIHIYNYSSFVRLNALIKLFILLENL